MTFNLFIVHEAGGFNLLDLAEGKLAVITKTYKRGEHHFTINVI